MRLGMFMAINEFSSEVHWILQWLRHLSESYNSTEDIGTEVVILPALMESSTWIVLCKVCVFSEITLPVNAGKPGVLQTLG